MLLLIGANNAQGASDMGCLPDFLPGYQGVEDTPGFTSTEMMQQAKAGQTVNMTVLRDGDQIEMPVKLTERPTSSNVPG